MFYHLGLVFVFVARFFIEILEMYESNYCACMCRAMAKIFASLGSCLYVGVSGGSSLNDISWAILVSVLMLKMPVLLVTMGMILISAFIVSYVCRACLSGS